MLFLYIVFLLYSELSVGMTTEGIDVRSVGNSLSLHETALVEAFNLKAAIEYQLKNCKSVVRQTKWQYKQQKQCSGNRILT